MMMEQRSLSSLTFKGCILEAVAETKTHKKLFLVYVSGDDRDSVNLEQSTLMDKNVFNSVSEYCIFLHLQQGSVTAAQLSAIFPQKSAPCITAIGYNGVQLWQHEGYIGPEDLVASIEKAWVSLNIQETTSPFLTATLASNKSETSSSSPNVSLSEERSLSFDLPSSLTNRPLKDLETKSPVSESTVKNVDASSESIHAADFKSVQNEKFASSSQTTSASVQPIGINVDNTDVGTRYMNVGNQCTDPEDNIALSEQGNKICFRSPQLMSMENSVQSKNAGASDSPIDAYKLNDILLNIRLLDGTSLQEKFLATDALRVVKDFINRNHTSGSGLYDLAIPYPRKIFGDQDLGKGLLELGLSDRQALIVVPRRRATGSRSDFGQSLSYDRVHIAGSADQSPDMSAGYWGYARRLLSYINPFTYVGSSSSSTSAQGSSEGFWQHSPNQHNQSSEPERPYQLYMPNPSRIGENSGKSRLPTSSPFGSNIHTLRRDEDDSQSKDRNTFWNGNSTQYGGNDDVK